MDARKEIVFSLQGTKFNMYYSYIFLGLIYSNHKVMILKSPSCFFLLVFLTVFNIIFFDVTLDLFIHYRFTLLSQ